MYHGIFLGDWVTSRRIDYRNKRLPAWLEKEFESIPGWDWSGWKHRKQSRKDGYNSNLKLLREYVAKHRWEKFSHYLKVKGVGLGWWVRACERAYRGGRLDHQSVKELEAIPGWGWTPAQRREKLRDERDRQRLEVLRELVDQHGWAEFRLRKTRGVGLGWWVDKCRVRYRQGKLARWLVAEFESIPGWSWSGGLQQHERYRRQLKLLREYVAKHGWDQFGTKTVVSGVKLGLWATTRRQDYRKGKLEPAVVRDLEAIPGWKWSLKRR